MSTQRKCLISKRSIEKNYQVGKFQRIAVSAPNHSGWIFFAGEEGEEFMKDPTNFAEETISTVLFYNPKLRDFLDAPVGSLFTVGEQGTERRTQKAMRGFWGNHEESYASDPAQVQLDVLQWIKSYPFWPILWHCLFLLFLFLSTIEQMPYVLYALILLGICAYYWHTVTSHFGKGCAHPGIVVNMNPLTIAVYTDLSKGNGRYPVIKLVKKRIRNSEGLDLTIGTRLPMVATYSDWEHSLPYWADFDPKPLHCATTDVEEAERLMAEFKTEEWAELDRFLKQLPEVPKPGLYRVDVAHSDWKWVV